MLFGLAMVGQVAAQEFECSEPKKKAKKLYDKLQTGPKLSTNERMAKLNEIKELEPEFVEVLDELSHIYERKAESLAYDPKTYQKSVRYDAGKLKFWQEIASICPQYAGGEFLYKLGKHYFVKRQYTNAKPYLKKFLEQPEKSKKLEPMAQALMRDVLIYEKLISTKVPFEPKKVSGGANSGFDEYLPMLSPDNRYLYFTRKKKGNSKGTFKGDPMVELLTESRRMGKNFFSSGVDMPERFNKGQYQGGMSISVDNRYIFLTVVEMVQLKDGRGFANGDIFMSEKIDGRWSDLKALPGHINGRYTWEGQPCISSDNRTLYFASAREPGKNGHIGGMDIYKCERDKNGNWGPIINLGDSINTPYDEKSPFMHADSYTLYFSSNGHIGMGGQDIFYAKATNDGKFRRAVNLGNPINTDKDEVGFIVSTDGKFGYFSSNLEGGSLDIYSFELYEQARPKKVLFVEGDMKTKSGKVPEDVEIELKSTKSVRKQNGVVDKITGKYVAVIAVDEGEDVLLTAKKKGYAFSSQLVSSGNSVVGKPNKVKKMELQKIEEGDNYEINDINFATNSYELNSKAKFILTEFVDFLKVNPSVKIAVHGYTDNVGEPEDNLMLSKNRAKAVAQFLESSGINSSRLTSEGFGETNPLASNDTEQGRAINRRTEFVILKK